MSATQTETRDPFTINDVRDHLRELGARADTPERRSVVQAAMMLTEHLPTTRRMTLKDWMKAHHGESVATLQYGVVGWSNSHESNTGYVPRPSAMFKIDRTVNARSYATYFLLDESRADYVGTVLGSDDDTIAVQSADFIRIYRVNR